MSESPQHLKPPRYPWIGKRPFYGWIIVFVAALTQFFQGIAGQGFTTYMGPLQAQFGWSNAALAGPRSVTQVEGAITGPLEGFMVDRFGPRKVAAAGILVMGLGFILFGLTNSTLMYYVSSIVITLGTGFQGMLVLSVTVNNWFYRRRTIAQSLMGLGFSMAGVVGIPALVFLQKQFDWRVSAYITAAFICIIGLPFVLLLRIGPETVGEIPDGKTLEKNVDNKNIYSDQYDFTLKQAIKTRSFWFLSIGSAISNLGILGAQVFLFLHLEGIGLDRGLVALVWTVASLVSIPARLLGGYFGDKLPKNIMLGVSMILMGVALYILAVTETAFTAFSFSVIFGIGWGMRTPILSAIQGEYFGRKSQGVIRGWLQSLGLPIVVAAPVVTGHMADVQGTFKYAFFIMAAIILAGSIIIFCMTRPKTPAYSGKGIEN